MGGIAEAWKWNVTVPVEHLVVTYGELRDAVATYMARKHVAIDAISDATVARFVQSLLQSAVTARRVGQRDNAISHAVRAGVAAFLLVERGEQRRERRDDAREPFYAITCRRGSERNAHTITQAYERASASAGALVTPASEGRVSTLSRSTSSGKCACVSTGMTCTSPSVFRFNPQFTPHYITNGQLFRIAVRKVIRALRVNPPCCSRVVGGTSSPVGLEVL